MQRLILFTSIIFLVSCSVSVRVPGNRFHTPETVPEHKGSVGLGRAGMGKVELTQDFESQFIEERDFNLEYSSSLHGSIAYGPVERLEIGAFYNNDSSTSIYGKFNFLKSGDFLLSGVLSLGLSGDQKTASIGGSNSSVDINFFNYDAGLLAGLSLSERFMIYSGAYYLRMSYEGTHKVRDVSREVAGSIASPTLVYGFQWKLSRSLSLVAEGAYSMLGASVAEDEYNPDQFQRDLHSWGVKLNIY